MSDLNFDTLANGALKERFNDAMSEVLSNIVDPNTEAKKVRKITLTLSFHPNEKRDFSNISFTVKPTLVPPVAVDTKIFIDRDLKGKVIAAEVHKILPGQMVIEDAAPEENKVIPMQKTNN